MLTTNYPTSENVLSGRTILERIKEKKPDVIEINGDAYVLMGQKYIGPYSKELDFRLISQKRLYRFIKRYNRIERTLRFTISDFTPPARTERVKVQWESRYPDAFLDVASGKIWIMSFTAFLELKEKYEGALVYRSHSGLSGEGWLWLPDSFKPIGTFRRNYRGYVIDIAPWGGFPHGDLFVRVDCKPIPDGRTDWFKTDDGQYYEAPTPENVFGGEVVVVQGSRVWSPQGDLPEVEKRKFLRAVS